MENPELMLAPDPADEGAGAPGEVRDLNPHLRPRSRTDYACPHGLCGGEGFILDEETNVAKPCPCRAQRIAHARSRRLRSEIPERYRDIAFDRTPCPRSSRRSATTRPACCAASASGSTASSTRGRGCGSWARPARARPRWRC